ncbi:hypothetical protein [Antrihabitans stalactiti]|uniref:Uncharacterized protein n=1 Tax=Antrihabitans stalactiti TaxID=2584121 RepID=A0A848KJ27_9NOCA|nr:hypothetical protein [Antrihabitans stalactiti]NMN97826.1 hypothetical protein [Antrihabitans stalactiti]
MTELWHYDRWQAELASVYLRPTNSKAPIMLFVDDQELQRAFGKSQPQPVISLARAVASQLDWNKLYDLFSSIERRQARWRLGDRANPPPTLPVLVLSVLAASRMEWDRTATASAYYPRLQAIFSSIGHKVDPTQLSHSYGSLPAMWEELRAWMASRPSEFGPLKIQNHPHLNRIGYSLSQAVVRGGDRAMLTSFFEAIDLDPQDVPHVKQLLDALRLWCTRNRGFSSAFATTLASGLAAELIGPILGSLASTWDRTVVASGGRHWLPFRLAVDLEEGEASWVVKIRAGLEGDLLRFRDGTSVSISRPEWGSFYEIDGDLPSVAEMLMTRFRADGDNAVAMHKAKSIYVLTFEPSEGKWIETTGIEPFEAHLLVVTGGLSHDVENLLNQTADHGWRKVPQLPSNPLVAGATIFRNVSFSSSSAFAVAMRRVDPSLREQIRPDRAPMPRLANGLKLATTLSDHQYICGGEPDLLLPLGATPRRVTASLDGIEQTFMTSDFPISLRGTIPLSPGRHVLVADGRTLVFHTCERVSALGRPANEKAKHLRKWTAEICLDTHRRTIPPVFSRDTSTETWAVNSLGHAIEIKASAVATWMESRGISPAFFEPHIEPHTAWIVRKRGTNIRMIDIAATQTPQFQDLNLVSRKLWNLIADECKNTTDQKLRFHVEAFLRWNTNGR